MKLDKTKPYGTINGHHAAAFVQGEQLFDGAGNPVDPEDLKPAEPAPPTSAQIFLENILEGAPMSQSNVYKEVEICSQDWEGVKNAAILMNIKKYKRANIEMWALADPT